jgi:small subunit ribosomal protein S20
VPIIKSAKKALRQNRKRRLDNLKRKKDFRKALKEIRILVDDDKTTNAAKLLPSAYKKLDKAAKKNTIKKNTASRYKSRITRLINKGEAEKKASKA